MRLSRTRSTSATTRVLLDLARAVEPFAPGAARARVRRDAGWGLVTIEGHGRQRPGSRIDRRNHVLSATTDGRFVKLTYRVAQEFQDAESLVLEEPPSTRDLSEVAEFFARYVDRIWWQGDPASAADRA